MDRGRTYIEAGRQRIQKNDRYDLSMGEMDMLVRILNEDFFSALGDAFYLGVEAGARMTEKGRC